jgi:peptide/nickel transport system permease protein
MIGSLSSRLAALALLSVIAFALARAAPGDPAAISLRSSGEEPTAEAIARLHAELGLDASWPEQYLRWLAGLAQLDLGLSLASRRPVGELILERLPATLELTAAAFGLTLLLGLAGGFAGAGLRGRRPDRLVWLLALVGASLPGFWLGQLLAGLFGVQLGWLPVAGRESAAAVLLPALTLALGHSAVQSRFLRAGLLGALAEPHALVAQAKGLAPGQVLRAHAWPLARGPQTLAFGLALGQMLAGALVVETVFAWPGLGRLAVDSLFRRDYPVVQAYVLLIGVQYLLLTALAELAAMRGRRLVQVDGGVGSRLV